jgi:hypothetical protein
MAVQFPKGTFKVDPGPGEHGVSVLFKPPQSTIVFSITSSGALATEYQVYHVNAAASVALAKRKLSKLRERWHCILSKGPGRDRRLREQWG